MGIKQSIRNWLLSNDSNEVPPRNVLSSVNTDAIEQEAAQMTFAFIKAMNGRLIKVSAYKPVSRGPDWTHELYIVKDDEKITDVIARIMAIKALEQ